MLEGACHCGAVQFRVADDIAELTTCDCSLCAMRGALMATFAEHALQIVAGETDLLLYQWNTHRAKHYFCRHCGIYVFHRKRAAPDHFGINVRCLQGVDIAAYPVRATEGANMTIEDSHARRPSGACSACQ